MGTMKILLLTPQLPYPPRQGTTIRNFNLIRYLARQHELHLFTFLAPGEVLAPDNRLWRFCRRIESANHPIRSLSVRALDTIRRATPDMGLRLESPIAHATLARMLDTERYDIVQIEGIEMAQYGLAALDRQGKAPTRGQRPRLVFDDHNVEYLLQKRAGLVDLRNPRRWIAAAYSIVQWQKLRRYEAHICRRVDAITAVSEVDASALSRLVPGADITTVPNGIDLADYPVAAEQEIPGETPSRIVFTGKMDYRPNIDAVLWFGRQVLPLIQQETPDARFQIVGMNPSPRLDELRSNPGVEITGAVDDVRPYIREAAVYVVPMRVGGGTRFKVLEAMASGKALVSTTLGVEGIPVEAGRHLLIADTPEQFAASVVSVLKDQRAQGELAAQLGREARAFVASHYSWEQIIPRMEDVYRRLRPELTDSDFA